MQSQRRGTVCGYGLKYEVSVCSPHKMEGEAGTVGVRCEVGVGVLSSSNGEGSGTVLTTSKLLGHSLTQLRSLEPKPTLVCVRRVCGVCAVCVRCVCGVCACAREVPQTKQTRGAVGVGGAASTGVLSNKLGGAATVRVLSVASVSEALEHLGVSPLSGGTVSEACSSSVGGHGGLLECRRPVPPLSGGTVGDGRRSNSSWPGRCRSTAVVSSPCRAAVDGRPGAPCGATVDEGREH